MAIKRIKKYTVQLVILLLIIAAFFAGRWLLSVYVFSRDAFVFANIVNINSRVSGPVTAIYVKENQKVKKGQKLFQIDPKPFQYNYDKAVAELRQAEIDYRRVGANIQATIDSIKQKQEALELAQTHLNRYSKLLKPGYIPQLTVIDVMSKVIELKDNILKLQNDLQNLRLDYNTNEIMNRKAQVRKAKYYLDHTTVYAPSNGYVTNFYMRVGDYVVAGEGQFALVQSDEWWVITRYRETTLRHLKIGDKVDIFVDMYPDKTFHGYVESIGWGINRVQASSNAANSTLPYLQPTEYWIRIAQRFPVRIRITNVDPNYPLRIGANAKTVVRN